MPDYESGHCSPSDRSEFEVHLKSCPECRDCLALMQLLRRTSIHPEQVVAEHFPSQLLETYYTNPGSLAPHTIMLLERHLRDCSTCSADLQFLNALESDLFRLSRPPDTAPETVFRKVKRLLVHPALPYAAALLLSLPAYQWLTQKTVTREPIQQRLIPIVAIELSEGRRGNEVVTEVTRSRDQALLLLQISLSPLPSEKVYSFDLSDGQSDTRFSPEGMIDVSKPDQIRLLVDGSTLHDGEWVLHIYEISRATISDTTFADYLFQLRTE